MNIRNLALLFLSAATVLTLSACTSATENTDATSSSAPESSESQTTEEIQQEAAEYMEHLQEGDISLSPYEKRSLAIFENSPPATLEMAAGETYTIELPFEANSVTVSTDDDTVVKVDDTTLKPVSNGSCLVHVDADGLQFHTIVTVYDAEQTATNAALYAAYTEAGFNADTIKSDIEVYATSKCGFTAIDELSAENGAETADYEFSLEFDHAGVDVKYKLLSVVDNLQEKGYTQISVSAELTDEAIVCHFVYA